MKNSYTQEKLIQSMQAIDNISDAPLNQGQMSNFGAIHKIGNEFQAAGSRDITDPNSYPIDANTMMGEASVGKIRFAGLAYMLEEDGVIDLQQNAKEFFSSRKMTKFLEEKDPKNIPPSDNIVVANWRDKANNINRANAAGGMFVSVNESEKYFKEFG